MQRVKLYTIGLIAMALCSTVSAQQVNTLFFLENAPMRHLVNPALQPVSNGYIAITPLGYMGISAGNNSLTLSDVYKNYNGQTVTALHPSQDKNVLLKQFRKNTLINAETQLNILSFGFRLKNEKGYVHINISERFDVGNTLPKSLFELALGGGMKDLDGGNNLFNLQSMGFQINGFTEIAGGYSHKINDKWTVGGKLKLLLGQAYASTTNSEMELNASSEAWHLKGKGAIIAAIGNGIINPADLPVNPTFEDLEKIGDKINMDYMAFLRPAGYGGALDLGFTYKPHPQVQISAALVDLGFIYWAKPVQYNYTMDTTYVGVGDFEYKDYVYDNKFQPDSLLKDMGNAAKGLLKAMRMTGPKAGGFAGMLTTKLNVGVDFNFCNNILGLGILSQTKLYQCKLYEEVTIGGALRPCNWFNLAVSYSLINNGKYSNFGAGLSFMPYDGINLTLAADYIPTSFASINNPKTGKEMSVLPYKLNNVNVALGFTIVWGTNHKKDRDKDGVQDKFDMCPNTPKNVLVDKLGCPYDTDGDGVPDYLDECPNTPVAAYGLIDSVGCPFDTDGDEVPDYLDECPNTPVEARGQVDEKGCPIDSDGDGVPDYIDQCPNTPAAAIGYLDSVGCPLDTDGDGVPDYLDQCPNTPAAAIGYLDSVGCPLDTDGDGVPDYLDECPNTPVAARGFVDAKGCELDSDGDGVPDYKDECPMVPGTKANRGCPEVKKEIRNLLQKAMQGIEFETGKATIKSKSFPLLNEIAQTFIDNPAFQIEVQGHTDNTGSDKLNTELSDKRAKAVREYLVKQGVPADRMTANGYGPTRPIADNKTKAGRQKNRRVEFNITFEEITYETVLDHPDEEVIRQDSILNAEKEAANAINLQQTDSVKIQ